ncbi:NusG domain II-containing protein [Clostridium senegalense]|uniref:NusG domain II-containing protein n=1 Tax=Clostridium senegalense TaxID=1465809 RepID=UPI001FD3775C|nr:NusG domain II-containing protein [Clostridium senegalense]
MKVIKKLDIIIIVILFFISFIPYLVFYVNNSGAISEQVYAVVTSDGKVFKEIRLDNHVGEEEFKLETKNGYNIIKVMDNKIGIIDSDCKDKVCKQVGYIHRVGETVVCLPHKVVIEIKGNIKNNNTEEDFISG